MSFSDERVWQFLDRYYEGRIPRENLESDHYSIARCNSCALLFQENILNDANMYLLYEEWISAEDSLNKKQHAEISLFKGYILELENACQILMAQPHEIKVLEFGMGWGFWSNLAKTCNFNITGVELSRGRIEFAQKNGVRVIEDISQLVDEKFDYIYSNQVFEHIPDPRETLQKLTNLLSANGVIHIQVPNGKGMEKELQSAAWKAEKDALHPLEHINCFSRETLKILANQAGLSLLPPVYRPNLTGIKQLIGGFIRFLHDSRHSTQVYLTKVK